MLLNETLQADMKEGSLFALGTCGYLLPGHVNSLQS